MNRNGIVLIVATVVFLLGYIAGHRTKMVHASVTTEVGSVPAVAAPSATAPLPSLVPKVAAKPDAQSQARTVGHLSSEEKEALVNFQSDQAAHQEAVEAKLRSWESRAPASRTIDIAASDIARDRVAADLRLTLWLRRVAAKHGLEVACFVGIVQGEQARHDCGAKLWGFDLKTGEISTAAEPPK